MSNTFGLILIGMFIASIVAFVIFVDYMARNFPDTRMGQICKKINDIIARLPDD